MRTKLSPLAALALVVLLLSQAEGAERFENAEVCLYDEKNEASCREAMGWGVHCHERHRCRTKDVEPLEYNETTSSCSEEEAAKRAGHVCAGFPYYNGGYPLAPLVWDSEEETYQCAKSSANGEYCKEWLAMEDSPDEWEAGACKCQEEKSSPTTGRKYCYRWRCEQIEVDKCKRHQRMIRPNYRE